MPEVLKALFESYRDGWNAFDSKAIAAHYRIPATILDMDGLQTYTSTNLLARKFEANCQTYRKLGYEGAYFRVGAYIANGAEAATVDLGWRIILGDEQLDFRTTYLCALVARRWRIVSAVAYDGGYDEDGS